MSSIFNFEINFFYRFDFKSYQKQKRFFLREIRGQSKKSVSWSRPYREVGFFCMVFSMSQISHFKYFHVVKFWLFLLYFMRNFGVKAFQIFKNGSKLVLPDRTGIWHVKNQTFIYHFACCLNKTTKTINKLTNEQPSSHFFLTDPLYWN